MRFLSVCSGMEAASVAWEPLGWKAVGFSEIEPFPCAILKHRFPNTPNYGSLTEYQSWPLAVGDVDLLCGGTPCQSYSVAGKRAGLNDPRGQLMLSFLDLAQRLKVRWLVWENVPGVLSSGQPRGSDFATFLQGLVERGYGWAYRVLDAQYVGGPGAVPQRRRRVFVVACLGDWRAPAEVFFKPESLCRNIAKGRKKGQATAPDAGSGVEASGPIGVDFRHERFERNGTVGTIQSKSTGGYSLNYAPGVAVPFRKSKRACSTTATTTLKASDADQMPHVAIQGTIIGRGENAGPQGTGATEGGPMFTLTKTDIHGVATPMAVRRLTPTECERLQGFPDNWSRIPWKGKPEDQCPDGPRYKACGNSMAVPVMRWIGEQIARVELSHNPTNQTNA